MTYILNTTYTEVASTMIKFKLKGRIADTKIVSLSKSELLIGYMLFRSHIIEHYRKISNDTDFSEFKEQIRTIDELINTGKLHHILEGDKNGH